MFTISIDGHGRFYVRQSIVSIFFSVIASFTAER